MLKHFIIVVMSVIIVEYFLKFYKIKEECKDVVDRRLAPKYWVFKDDNKTFIFESVERILVKLGLEKVSVNTSSADTMRYDWDLLWTYNYMTFIPLNYSKLHHWQKINHIPGNYVFISKSVMSSTTILKYVPKGFVSAEALKEFSEQNPTARFVEKMKANRGVKVKNIDDINWNKTESFHTDRFAQVFVDDPFLIDGHKFDFNVFVAITSVNPLRVYYYANDFHMRFCNLPYNPNNFTDANTYVIGDIHIPGHKFPAIKKYFDKSYKFKDAFNMYLIERGHDPSLIYHQIEDCIQALLLSKEPSFIQSIANMKAKFGKYHFFELVRFDFLIDSKLQVHLMEVNMSPNLYIDPKIHKNRPLFESAIYNTFNLLGIGSYLMKQHIRTFLSDEEYFTCDDNSVSVQPEVCINMPCNTSCDDPRCELCWNCLEANFKVDLKFAYMEHLNIGLMKRVVPPPNEALLNADDEFWNSLSSTNMLYAKWCIEMCKDNRNFC